MTTAWRGVGVILLAGMICGAAWAGNVSVEVKDGGAGVPSAMVQIEPDGPNGTTNAAGKWNATGVPAGDYRVISWKTLGGAVHGGITDVTVPAAGNVHVTVNYSEAIWTSDYFPYAVGNSWQYRYRHVGADGAWSGTWREHVDRAVTMDGDAAVVLAASIDGTPEWEEIRGSTRNGFVLYTMEDGGDVIKYDPPLRLGPLMPVGYEWVATSTARHGDGSPDTPVELRVTLVGLGPITVPAGTFANSARLQVVQSMGAETNSLDLWVSRGVGITRQVESNPERTNTKLLEEYRIVGRLLRPIMRPIRPVLPH